MALTMNWLEGTEQRMKEFEDVAALADEGGESVGTAGSGERDGVGVERGQGFQPVEQALNKKLAEEKFSGGVKN